MDSSKSAAWKPKNLYEIENNKQGILKLHSMSLSFGKCGLFPIERKDSFVKSENIKWAVNGCGEEISSHSDTSGPLIDSFSRKLSTWKRKLYKV